MPAPLRTNARAPLRTGALATARTVARVMPGTAVLPIAEPAGQAPARPPTAAARHRPGVAHRPRRARVHSVELPGAPPTADREGTAGYLLSAGAQPHPQVTSHGGQAAPGRAAPDQVPGPPAAPTRTASPADRPGPRPATVRDGPHQAAIRGAVPGPGVLRAGPPMVRAHEAEVQSMTADTPRAAGPAVPARLVRRVPPAAPTGVRVHRVRGRTARAGTTPTGARLGRVALGPVPIARRIGRSVNAATPPGGRHVTGRRDPRATKAATGPRGRLAAATATVPAAATVPATATVPAVVTVPAVATVPGAASGAEAAAGSVPAADVPEAGTGSGRAADVPGPRETRHRLGRPASPGRSCQIPSLLSSSTPRRVPS